MTEPTDALPCPFCESQPTAHNDTDGPFWVVACGNLECAAQPETSGKTEADAIAAWNRRTPPAVAPWRSAVLDLIDDYPGLALEQDRWLSRRVKELDFASTPQPTQAQAGAVPQHQPTPDVQAKMAANQWDHFGDILPTLKAISRGDWYWGANSRCKYIEIRLDTRDGGCLLYDRERVRISPEQFAHQSHPVRMEPWPGIKGGQHGADT